MGNFRPSRRARSGEQVNSYATANATGGGFDGAETVTTYIEKINGEIITTILVDITGLASSGTVKDIIGEDGVAAAYIMRITTAKNGIIYKAEMGCIERPNGSVRDIDLVTNTASLAEDVEYDSSGTAVMLVAAASNLVVAVYRQTANYLDMTNCVGAYLYLVTGVAGSGGTYTSGKLIIKLYGADF